ncbi:hypothetical protein EVAR_44306_1 [Eumeta japonica]|uniref:Tc1-like transposase DDE domain-containing protein n=1 Tax=Eumeta variegata TaxID=151549 RepID=A0A4C1WT88_EUMVA|nr:hypothetical protein EVAR_44306_1 [Eumeta japonica]
MWVDTTTKSNRQVFLEDTGAKQSTSKENTLVIVQIGNEDGFVKESGLVFENNTTNDYHEIMDVQNFEKWFLEVLPKLGQNSVVVMDNAPYHSRYAERIPRSNWKKADIQQWLKNKNIPFEPRELRVELLEKVKKIKDTYKKYAIDELAKKFKVEVLRLPPYHCELNPIELIWADVKGNVARNDITFNYADVKKLFNEALEKVTPEKWKKYIKHTIKEEKRLNDIDFIMDDTLEKFIINDTSSESDTCTESESD